MHALASPAPFAQRSAFPGQAASSVNGSLKDYANGLLHALQPLLDKARGESTEA